MPGCSCCACCGCCPAWLGGKKRKDSDDDDFESADARREKSMLLGSDSEVDTSAPGMETMGIPVIEKKLKKQPPKKANTPLHAAARKGQEKLVRKLLHDGADPRAKDGSGYTPLHWAAFRDRVNICKILIDAGANVNSKNHFDNTALVLAAWHGRTKVLEALIERGARVNHAGENGNTALHYTARSGDLKTTKRLVEEYGADPNVRNAMDKFPVDVAKGKTKKYLATVTDKDAVVDESASLAVANMAEYEVGSDKIQSFLDS